MRRRDDLAGDRRFGRRAVAERPSTQIPASVRRERAGDTELYWHFVTGVWFVLFGILYLW